MPKRKLTASLKKKIKENYHRLKKADYDGDALAYLNRVRGAAKGRKAKAFGQKNTDGKTRGKSKPKQWGVTSSEKQPKRRSYKQIPFYVHGIIIEPGTEAYGIVAASARMRKMSIARFVKENEEAIADLIDGYLVFSKVEIDKLIQIITDLPSKKKTFVPTNGKERPRVKVIFLLHSLKSFMLATCEIYEQILIEFGYDLFGNVHVDVPYPVQYTKFECEELLEWLDENYPNISYFKND